MEGTMDLKMTCLSTEISGFAIVQKNNSHNKISSQCAQYINRFRISSQKKILKMGDKGLSFPKKLYKSENSLDRSI